MKLNMHECLDEDYRRIRDFLREIFLLNGKRELSWQSYRFDYWRWHGLENLEHRKLSETVFIWETADEQIMAVLNPEGKGNAVFQVHPVHRTPELEEKMLLLAEDRLSTLNDEGQRKLRVWAHEEDDLRKGLLRRRGYIKSDFHEYQRRRPLSKPIPDMTAKKGYTVRALGGVEELPSRSYASWTSFHPDEPDDYYEGWEWYLNVQRAPLYRQDLDIVAVDENNEIASFCTVWFDDETGTGAFEPVGTAKSHQKRGLAKAVIYEGLRRLKKLGATMAHVGSYEPRTHSLYASIGFTEYDVCESWVKEW